MGRAGNGRVTCPGPGVTYSSISAERNNPMITRKGIYQMMAVLGAITALALITVVGKSALGLNATTVALLYLIVVLAISAFAGISCGIAVALVSGLLVNYFFLPPFGTLYISTQEDWVSFGVYTIAALVVSHFAATVRKAAVEAEAMKDQLSQLARFMAVITAVRNDELTLEVVVGELRRALGLEYCAIYNYLDKSGRATPVSSGSRPSSLLEGASPFAEQSNSLIDVFCEEGTAC
jgi:K+-sensing histidine kinase KdpD